MDIDRLIEPFPVDQILWRPGNKGFDGKFKALAYIDARHVMNRLDDVVGWSGWQTKDRKLGDTYYCELSIYANVGMEHKEWISKTGAAGATNIEGEKGGASDAFKRAAVLFGIGRYLYDVDAGYYPAAKGYFAQATKNECIKKLPNYKVPSDIEDPYPEDIFDNNPHHGSRNLFHHLVLQ